MALKRWLEEPAVPMGEAGEVGRPTLIAEFETSMYVPSSLTTDPLSHMLSGSHRLNWRLAHLLVALAHDPQAWYQALPALPTITHRPPHCSQHPSSVPLGTREAREALKKRG